MIGNIHKIGVEFLKPFELNWIKLQTTDGRRNLCKLLVDILDNDDMSVRRTLIKTDNAEIRDAICLISIYVSYLLSIHDSRYRQAYDLLYVVNTMYMESDDYWNDRMDFGNNRNDDGDGDHDVDYNADNDDGDRNYEGGTSSEEVKIMK